MGGQAGGVSRPRPRGVSRPTPGGVSRSRLGGCPGPGPGGCIPVCSEADNPLPPPQQTATAVGGTHPTGMHSYFNCLHVWCCYILSLFQLVFDILNHRLWFGFELFIYFHAVNACYYTGSFIVCLFFFQIQLHLPVAPELLSSRKSFLTHPIV